MIKIGDKIDDRYRIVSRIATGGMADVYEANDLISRRIVSIKMDKCSTPRPDTRQTSLFSLFSTLNARFLSSSLINRS